ncbi:TetR/AcrR family transcriptional regulator [Hankyongella ginsenosidimutans]|uniref:TetR/AcrR family transcriptional regulator n=1 Tax=Hankyongella ginsenosidimutans TaxID=1763828 RepID=A0A4D7C8K8_9SPHN|nr:TetR/AcrR family transcriptional regulator [Hankyongella ginsenosidimutans]QCI79818.1 TetR/AcrR family transcriptional regulator [Hankyongella ginsenosidimutans]
MSKSGRPSQFDRDAALDEALVAFWREGYQANSVKALSERLGITRSSFYNAFESREAMFMEAFERYLERSPDRALAAVPLEGSVCALITATFKTICESLTLDPDAKGCLAVNSVGALCNVDAEIGPKVAAQMIARLERIETLLKAAVARGELPRDADITATALALKTFLVGLNSMAKVLPNRSALWPAARATLAAFGLLCEDAELQNSSPVSFHEKTTVK